MVVLILIAHLLSPTISLANEAKPIVIKNCEIKITYELNDRTTDHQSYFLKTNSEAECKKQIKDYQTNFAPSRVKKKKVEALFTGEKR